RPLGDTVIGVGRAHNLFVSQV
ncbi:hypothetical protein P041_03055, partial [Brucella sp. 04-5288]